MKVIDTAIADVKIIEPAVFNDERGFFYESYNAEKFHAVTGLSPNFVQDNHSKSARGVVRGLHYQIEHPQGKLVPGMYASVLVDSGNPETVVTVPQTAVTFSLYGDNVFVVVPATKIDPKAKPEELAIERRFVKAGTVRDGRVQIVSGLADGDKVVTAGHNKIDQGSKVVIDNSIALRLQDSTTIQ